MAKTNEANAWVKQDTIDEATAQEGDWLTPVPGAEVEGRIERAFVTKNEGDDGFRACYGVRGEGEKGVLVLVGERASFKRAIRELAMTTPIRIKFTGKVELKTAAGKKTGKTPWRVEFFARPSDALPNSNSVKAELKKSYEALASNDLPF